MNIQPATTILIIVLIGIIGIAAYVLSLIIKALKVYIGSKEVRKEKAKAAQSLGEVLRNHRSECKMT